MVTRKDIDLLFDRGSFMEIGEGRGSSVVTGYGRVDDRMVYAFLQDSEKDGGVFSVDAASKIKNIYKLALKAKVPVVGLLDSTGYLIDEGAEGLNAFSEVYALANKARKDILQIMIVGGKCMGQMVSLASTADFFFRDMEMGEALIKTKELIRVMPPAKGVLPEQFETSDDLNRLNAGIEKLADSGKDVLKEISDDGFLLETDSDKAPELTTGFIKINGLMVAAIANNRTEKGSRISLEGLDKARKLVETANKFRLGLVKVSNTDGIEITDDQNLLISASGKLWDAFAKADIPMVDIITGAVNGGAYSLFNGRGTSTDLTIAWKSASVNIINPRQAAEILYGPLDPSDVEQKAQEYVETHSSAQFLEKKGLVDKVIEPEETRKYLAGALESYANLF